MIDVIITKRMFYKRIREPGEEVSIPDHLFSASCMELKNNKKGKANGKGRGTGKASNGKSQGDQQAQGNPGEAGQAESSGDAE